MHLKPFPGILGCVRAALVVFVAFLVTSTPAGAQTTAAPDFTGTVDPQVLTVRAGAVGVYNLSVIPLDGFNSDVHLSVAGLPGFNGNSTPPMFEFSPLNATVAGGSGQASLAVFTSSKTVPGTYNVFITGTSVSPAITHTAEVKLVILPFGPDFTGSLSNSTAFVKSGQSTTYGITVIPIDGFTGTVKFDVDRLPRGAKASFSPEEVTGGSGSTTLTISTREITPTGRFYPVVSGRSGELMHSTTVILDVNAPADFTGAVTPTNPTVTRGSSVTLNGTVVAIAGFDRTVSLHISGLPEDVRADIDPRKIVGGSGTYAVTIFAGEDAIPGSYDVTITGTDLHITHGTTITLTVD